MELQFRTLAFLLLITGLISGCRFEAPYRVHASSDAFYLNEEAQSYYDRRVYISENVYADRLLIETSDTAVTIATLTSSEGLVETIASYFLDYGDRIDGLHIAVEDLSRDGGNVHYYAFFLTKNGSISVIWPDNPIKVANENELLRSIGNSLSKKQVYRPATTAESTAAISEIEQARRDKAAKKLLETLVDKEPTEAEMNAAVRRTLAGQLFSARIDKIGSCRKVEELSYYCRYRYFSVNWGIFGE